MESLSNDSEHNEKRRKGALEADLLTKAKSVNARIDWNAIAMILMLGDLVDEISPFVGVRSVAKKYTDNNVKIGCFLDNISSINDVYDCYHAIICKSINEIPYESPCVLGLSGGRDSRHILLSVLSQQRRLPRLVTSSHFLGNLSQADITIAQKLASKLCVDIQTVQQPRDRFHQEWDKNIKIGLQSTSHSWGLALSDALNGPEVLLDGMNGGVLFGRSGLLRSAVVKFGNKRPCFKELREFVKSNLIENANKLNKTMLSSNILSTCVIDNVIDRVCNCFEKYEYFNNPIQSFQYHEHVRRNTRLFTYGLMKNEIVVCPFDSNVMVEFALNLPWEISCDHQFQNMAIVYLFPEFGIIPYAEQMQNLQITWFPDQESEFKSWEKLFTIVKSYFGAEGLEALEKSSLSLNKVQVATLLAQAIHWDEHGHLPSAHEFFRQ